MKTCSKCSETKALTDFYRGSLSAGYADGYQPWCKACKLKYDKARYHSRKEEWANRARLRKYGVTADDYASMLREQEGACAACRRHLNEHHVDHCHSTGRVRSILCRACNVTLGMFSENGDLLRLLAEYADAC